MTSRFRNSTNLLLASFLVLLLCVVNSTAQTKKKRSSRTRKAPVAKPVITNPDIAPPTAEANGESEARALASLIPDPWSLIPDP